MSDRLVFLVPGFFGFTTLGELDYFHLVRDTLGKALRERGRDAEILACPTQPTGSIPRRAERLREHVVASGGLAAREIHFVGHSLGGLDVRLVLTPGVRLVARDDSEEGIAQRTRSAISVVTPHHGTPLSSFFTTVQGRPLLLLLTTLATTRQGRGTLYAASRLGSLLARLEGLTGRRGSTLDALADQILSRVRYREDDPIWEYLKEVSSDQGAILQLTPEAMHLFNAAVVDRPGVAYGCVAAAAPRPPGGYGLRDLLPPQRAALRVVFTLLYGLTSRTHSHYPYPEPDTDVQRALRSGLGFAADVHVNDGIVPTRSQLHGRLLHVARADHLDVVGQFRRPGQALSDWLPSGARFDAQRFERLWAAVADGIVRTSDEATLLA